MNKSLLAVAFLASAAVVQAATPLAAQAPVNSHALAATAPAGGFVGPDALKPSTVAQALKLGDDVPVKVRGRFVRALGGDKYELRDDTGVITVDVDHDLWQGRQVTPNDLVEVVGEIDKGWRKTELEADRLQLLK